MRGGIQTDVVIAGAGIAGLSLAIGLARRGVSSQVLEAAAAPSNTEETQGREVADWDRRVSALTPAAGPSRARA